MERITNRVGENRVDRIQEKSVPSKESGGRRSGLSEAAYTNRSPAGFTDGGRRSVDAAGTRTAAHRRVGGWSATRGLTLGCIGFATRNRRRRSGALQGWNTASARPPTRVHPQGVLSRNPRPHRGRLQTGHPQGSPMEGVAPSTPRERAPRHTAGSWLALDAESHLGVHRVRHAQPAPTERRPPGVNAASSRPPTNRSPAGFTDGGRRVHHP